MKIFNIKIDIQKIIWISIIIALIIYILFFFINNKTIIMNNKNYTNILKDSHENISNYLGKKITTSGYIFRSKNFPGNHFVVARDMLISETEANIVGFLCEYPMAQEYENNEWVEVTGTIILGDYYGPIPIIKIDTIKRITTPNDIFVAPPKE